MRRSPASRLPPSFRHFSYGCVFLLGLGSTAPGAPDAAPLALVEQHEARRIAMIERAAPAVVCIFDRRQTGGGSGVLIDEEGYGLTNYHVVAGMLDSRRGWGGLSDGKLYPLEVLGIDPTGDVAMFRLTGRDRYPHVGLGDSDRAKVGDFAFAMGNPFELSEDYSPTVTMGIITGVHRYQWGVDGNLIYSDCLQVDSAINPGNSGGPLFNIQGEVIGINGRISVDTRGRFNVGFGYAITSNQIRRFVPALRAGLLARHGTLQATVAKRDGVGVVFDEVRENGAADRAGVQSGDRLITMDGVAIESPNRYVSVLGTYPAEWSVAIEVERSGKRIPLVGRLDPITPNLEQPFTVDREVNLRQTERVLRAFRRAVLGSDESRRPTRWTWTVVRQELSAGAPKDAPPKRFVISQAGDGPIRMHRQDLGGAAAGVIEYDDRHAVRRSYGGDTSFELPAEIQMVHCAMYVLLRWMPAPVELIDLTDVRHVGGGSQIQPVPGGAAREAAAVRSRPVELIDWPVAGHAVARFAFDAETHLINRIDVRDVPSGIAAVIELSDYRDIDGVGWPGTIAVNGAGFAHRDSLVQWELTP